MDQNFDIYKFIAELQALNAQFGIDNEDEYDENDPYAWLKPSSPKFYRQLTRSFKKDLKKKAREEKKTQKRIKPSYACNIYNSTLISVQL